MIGTLLELIRHWSEKDPHRIAIREKRFGIWNTFTWKDFYDLITNFALGLISLGMKPGDRLAIIGHNAPEWLIAELAAMRLGGSCLGIYPDMLIEEIVYLINASESRIVIARDQEQVDKVIEVWDRIKKNVIRVIVWDTRGMGHYFKQYPFLVRFKEVLSLGENQKAKDVLKDISIRSDLTALLLATSGATGLPKLVMVSHGNLLNAAKIWQEVHPFYETDELFCQFPLSWMGEQFNVARYLYSGFKYNFPESQASIKNDFRECQPTLVMMSPPMWEDICSDIRARMEDASFVKKLFYNYSLKLGLEDAEKLLDGQRGLVFLKKWLYHFSLGTTLRSLRQRVGLARCRLALTGGAAIGREVFTFYMALGINLMQLYGMTENCATITCHYPDDVRPETVGKPLPKVEIKLDDGMIYVKSPTNAMGYFNNPEETSAAYKDGWFKTGDSGYYDKYQHLVVLDRQKDLMLLEDGTRFSPQELENRLKFSFYIRQAVVFGDGREMVTAMISIDIENVGNWANKKNLPYTTFADLSQNDRVIDLIREEIGKINQRLPEKMRVRRFLLLPKELHPDDGELTRTRKIKRNVINERYAGLIESLFTNDKYHNIDIEIKYMDGNVSRLKSNVRLEDV
jgi:long-chain acyl-CoA synthetase